VTARCDEINLLVERGNEVRRDKCENGNGYGDTLRWVQIVCARWHIVKRIAAIY